MDIPIDNVPNEGADSITGFINDEDKSDRGAVFAMGHRATAYAHGTSDDYVGAAQDDVYLKRAAEADEPVDAFGLAMTDNFLHRGARKRRCTQAEITAMCETEELDPNK